ncbi:P-loop containing nucleoside triphosphate hydrolase protein [Dimargaris cristalligena]|uniref:P-loop containing nucleoside triphosphate hydrolase protein n=1 Tax=Dimargaris cristalligena TaxID=215637 RepID=A0A4P9ZVA7_9FUNG|nr:P-loop containing nucleoside triphosphate hydrolase protein [Dimargaris cristalligena]|eukprot:RKP36861.1 P-loop containing nucleoside triphosphate hydrolase protein [Dimargaris cristalligena]
MSADESDQDQVTAATSSTPQLGIIESVELVDFMCHEFLRVDLGSKINFVIGHNGSGKSAILTAIIICLGGKASATQRASSIKHLIREGCPRALVTLRIRNRGRDAYKGDVYGDVIIVERILSKDSSSGYRLRSSLNDRIVSTKRDDLLAICDHMAIQVDNPLNVLSQDSARQFLNATTSEDKYKFFLKGTQLAQLQSDHYIIQQGLDTTDSVVKHKKEMLPELYKEAKEWGRKYKDMQSARDLAVKLETLKQEMVWAQVEEQEAQHRTVQGKLARAQRKIPAVEDARAQEQVKLDTVVSRARDLEQELTNFIKEQQPLKDQHDSIQREIRSHQTQINQIQSEEQEIDREMKGLRKRQAELASAIEREQSKTETDLRAEREKRQKLMADHRATIQQLETDQRQTETNTAQFNQAIQEHQTQLGQIDQRLQRANRDVEQSRTTISQLRRNKENQITAFGPSMPDVMRSIQSETRWKAGKPLGPLGLYVQLSQPQWADTIESILSWSLNAFVVETHDDQKLLAAILHRHKCKSRVLVSKFEPFDYASGEPDPQYLTMLRVLKFSNEAVKCQLINIHRIEQTILIEQRAEADRVMSSNRGQFPRNVIACFTVDGFQVGRRGGFATMAVNPYRGPPRFARDLDALITKEEEAIRTHEEQTKELQTQRQQVNSGIRQAQKSLQGITQNIRSKQAQIRDLRDQIQRLEEELADLEPASLTALNQEQSDVEKQVELIRRQFADVHQQLVPLDQELKALREQAEEVSQATQRIQDNIAKTHQVADSNMSLRVQQEQRIQHWDRKREEAEQVVAQIQADLDKAQAELEQATTKAAQYCPERVPVTQDARQLDREIETIELRLRETERIHGADLETIAKEAEKRISAYRRAKDDIVAMETFIVELQRALTVRMNKWSQFRESIAVRAKANFLWHLAQRGYRGRLDFDHQKQRLNPRVQTEDPAAAAPNANGKLRHDKDPKSLSGGEKSFSTICLLLALWESMGCPIRCLDEFDVFMDAVNRKISMNMMIESARQATDTQYILITPQDMSAVSFGPDVRVHRLADPARRRV